MTAPAKASLIESRAAEAHHPRGPQPPGPPHVRGRRPPRRAPGAGPHRAGHRPLACRRGSWRALTADEVRGLEQSVAKVRSLRRAAK